MARLLKGKVAALTGATAGIGKAIAIEFVKHGACVVVNHYPDERAVEEFDEMFRNLDANAPLIAVPGDISKPNTGQELVETAVRRFGRLDVSGLNNIVATTGGTRSCTSSQRQTSF